MALRWKGLFLGSPKKAIIYHPITDKQLSTGVFRDTINITQPLVAGFSTYAENIDRVRFWARLAKHILPKVLTVLGGPQVTFMPPEGLLQMEG